MKLTYALVSMGFTRGKQEKLTQTARRVHSKLYAEAAYELPPVSADDLLVAINAVVNAQAAQAQGGTQATATKDQKRALLTVIMEELAEYVDETAKGDLAVLLSSGFEARSMNRTRTALDAPVIRSVATGLSGELLARVGRIANARGFEAEVAELGPDGTPLEWRHREVSTDSRRVRVSGLKPGTIYLIRVRAVGGTTGFSGWSEAVTQMCR